MFAPIANDAKHVCAHEIFAGVFTNHANDLKRPEDYINHSLYFEAKTFLHGLLTIEDKLSMAHGLESRVPFMDNDLVDFAMQCPVELKINNLRSSARINENDTGIKKDNYFQKTGDGKRILREAVSRYIPCEVAERKKQGFSSPDASWFRGESIDFVKRRLLNSQAAIYSVLDYKSVVPLVEQHLQGKKNNRLLIWSLLSVDTWMMEF